MPAASIDSYRGNESRVEPIRDGNSSADPQKAGKDQPRLRDGIIGADDIRRYGYDSVMRDTEVMVLVLR